MKLIPLTATLAISAMLLVACGKSEAPTAASEAPAAEAPAAAEQAAAPAATAAADENVIGKKVFGTTCSMCHASGLAGAPKPGNKDEWAPRIAKGMDVLHKHAIEGFTGDSGMMPARGGNASLSDEEVMAAVDFMVAQSQ